MRLRLLLAVTSFAWSSIVLAQWQLLPGLATDVGVGARGDVWVIGIDQVEGGHSIYRWTGNDWQIVAGGAARIDVDPQGIPWVVNSSNQIFRLGPGGWQQVPGLARDIGIGANGAVWVIGVTPVAGGFTVHRWDGRNWVLVPGGGVRIDVDPQGNPWVVNDRGDLFRRTPNGTWQRLAGGATSVTVATDGTAWALGTDAVPGGYSVRRWSGQRWQRVDGGAVAISAGRTPWAVNSEQQIFQWQGTDQGSSRRSPNKMSQ